MADAAGRALEVVKPPSRSAQSSPDTFAACVQQVSEAHADVASEGFWQDVSRLVVARWQDLSRDQAPVQSLAMVAKCTEVILRIRRSSQQSGAQSSAYALEEFREFMKDVTGKDDQA